MDWDARQSHTPATPANFIQPNCGGGGGACGRETHCESYPPSEALFDLATRDLPAPGFDAATSWQIAETLFMKSRQGSGGNVYNCSLPNSDGCNANGWYNTMRTADDDDGNLSNGTPHAAAIFAAFNRHAIACGGVNDTSNKNSTSCPALAAPDVTGVAGSSSAVLLMAPTEILAEQHYRNLSGTLQALGLRTILMRGGERATVKKAQGERLASGDVQVAIGTHSLIQQWVRFKNLGLAVVAEQHKFGVLQRKTLIDKGYKPDVLVLTATPIPRTLAMTVYGDLDVSVIDILPPGRKPVRTFLFHDAQRRRAYQIVRDELRADRQAYVVYPLVEESEKTDLQAAIQGAEQLQSGELSEFRVGLLHGRMKAAEKEAVMADFKAGTIQVLVATTVIEVGVDVQNATVILIEHAERFGLCATASIARTGGAEQPAILLPLDGSESGAGKDAVGKTFDDK